MLSEYFSDRRTVQHIEDRALTPHLEGVADAMQEEGYSRAAILQYLRTAIHLAEWAQTQGIALVDLNEATIEAFRDHLPQCECPWPRLARSRHRTRGIRTQARRFLTHLRETGSERPAASSTDSTPQPTLLVGFNAWMQQHRGVRPATLISYGRIIVDAIGELGNDPSRYDAANLRAFVVGRSSRHGRSKAKLIVTAMRMFLRYLSAEGHCLAGLEGAIPTVAHWSLSALPRYLTPTEVDQVIETCDPTTPGGLRDRAVMLLLSRLGLRASDVAFLCFSDIDWDDASMCVSGKSRQTSRLPLPQDVGDALLAYLEQGRPAMQSTRVFFRVCPPWKPIEPSAVTGLVRRAIRRAGISSPAKGAHLLRHSSAVRMLRDGASLEQIRTILRHRDPDTTTIYAKVDKTLLQQVTQAWPEVTL